MRDERARGGAIELEPEARGLRAHPLGQLPGLDGGMCHDLAAGALDCAVQRGGRLRAPLLACEQRERRGGRHRRERGSQLLLDVGLLPALDALDEDHATDRPCAGGACGERHRRKRPCHTGGRREITLERLGAPGGALALGQRPQPGAPLGDRAVILSVDQIGGLQLGHCLIAPRG